MLRSIFKYAFVFLAASSIICCACSSGDEPVDAPETVTFSVSPDNIIISDEAQTYSITVRANANWSITADCDWISTFPSGGVKNQDVNVKLTLTANKDLESRFANLVLQAGSSRKEVKVEQTAAAKVVTSVNSLTFGAQASVNQIEINSNLSWTAASNESWCHVTPLQGTAGLSKLDVSCDENSSNESRYARVTITYNGGSCAIDVTQMSDVINVPEGYTLVWNDEFNEGSEPGDKWWYETGAGGWGNNELQYYVKARQGNDILASVEGGILSIICKKIGNTVYSIRMNTNDSWKYGYFEARLKLPKGKGTWPAFWMMPKNFTTWPGDGEIDIMEEVGYKPDYVSSSIHCNSYNHVNGTQKTREKLIQGAQDDFHIYALEWTPDFIRTYVDGVELFYFANDKKNDKNTWPFNAPFYLKLNLAWGGNWGGAQGIDESALPAIYQIDYVRVFQKQ